MENEEKEFRKNLREPGDKYHDRPEIALAYARWLFAHQRYADAALVTHTALDEGPRFDLYELRALTTLSDLEDLWVQCHTEQKKVAEKSGGQIYNEGLETPAPDWGKVLQQITGS